uniref:Nucleosome assembly protein 1 like 1 n=2 Tax=Canis lupus familiaris TaxID=9615 RepID=A0A8C0S1D4_CANLF
MTVSWSSPTQAAWWSGAPPRSPRTVERDLHLQRQKNQEEDQQSWIRSTRDRKKKSGWVSTRQRAPRPGGGRHQQRALHPKRQRNLQQRPGAMPPSPGRMGPAYPSSSKMVIKALRNLQAQYAQVEAQFYRDSHDLEKKYAAFYQPLFDKRSEIINAIHEPTEGECQWQVGVQEGAEGHTNGIPHFWLTAFKIVKILNRMIQKNDELVLEHLEDVKIKISGFEEPMRFTIEFIFKSNEYFCIKVLTKTYHMQSEPDDSDPFFSKGPEIISSTGCKIYWKEGKDVTVKTSKLQRGKGRRSFASTTRTMPGYSFFTYFYPPHSPEGREMDVTTDYKLGYFFREVLVPKSLLFFTNEARDCNYESADYDAREAGGEEKKVEVIRNEDDVNYKICV